jgi:hypothetical protein
MPFILHLIMQSMSCGVAHEKIAVVIGQRSKRRHLADHLCSFPTDHAAIATQEITLRLPQEITLRLLALFFPQ